MGGWGRFETVKSSLRVLEESCLVPFPQQLLENDSLLSLTSTDTPRYLEHRGVQRGVSVDVEKRVVL